MSSPSYTPGPPGGVNEIDLAAFGKAYNLVKDQLGPFLVMGIMMILPQFIVSAAFRPFVPQPEPGSITTTEQMMAFYRSIIPISGVQNLVTSVVQGAFMVVGYSICLAAIRRGKAEFEDFGKGFKKAGIGAVSGLFMMLVYSVMFAPVVACLYAAPQLTPVLFLVCALASIVFSTLSLFFYCEIAEGKNPIQALQGSINLTRDKFFVAFAFLLVMGLVIFAGLCGCCVAVVFTLPIGICAVCVAYTELTGTGFGSGMSSAPYPYSPYPRGAEMPSPYPPQDPPAPPSPPAP